MGNYSVLSSVFETVHFGSLSVYSKEVLHVRAPSINVENVLQFISSV